MTPAARRDVVRYLQTAHRFSERRACRAVAQPRSVQRHVGRDKDDSDVIELLQEMAARYPDRGFPKYRSVLRERGVLCNHKRLYRVYRQLKLNRRRRAKRRLPTRQPQPLVQVLAPNTCWSMDFMSDALWSGRRFRTFNIIDDFNREVLAIEIDLNLPAARVVRVLDRIATTRGYPERLRMDNGPEFISGQLAAWASVHGILLDFIKPGRPMQNGYIERFNRSYREAVLDQYVFRDLDEVREETERWIVKYNEELPHESLGNRTPAAFLAAANHAANL